MCIMQGNQPSVGCFPEQTINYMASAVHDMALILGNTFHLKYISSAYPLAIATGTN